MNQPHKPFFTILIILLGVVFFYAYMLKHEDNYQPSQIIRNDGYAKSGASGYNPFRELSEHEAAAAHDATETHHDSIAVHSEDVHGAQPAEGDHKKTDDHKKAEPKGGHH